MGYLATKGIGVFICLTIILFNVGSATSGLPKQPPNNDFNYAMQFAATDKLVMNGIVGETIEASRMGRLHTFITGIESKPLTIFNKDSVAKTLKLTKRPDGEDYSLGGGWLAEHAGKWMITAARAASRSGDEVLEARIKTIADFLLQMQEPDGYLGTYAPSVRLTAPLPYPKRTWDVWIHSYLILSFLEINKYWPDERYVVAATKIADLCEKVFGKNGYKSLAYMGNHVGLSGTILLEPIVEIYNITKEKKYLDFAEHIVWQMEERPGLEIVSRSLDGRDLEVIGDGKVYQLNWNFVGIAKLYAATGNEKYLKAVKHAWQNTVDYHLTLGGGPWGGVGRHAECYNKKGYFSPYGFVETCNTMSWIQLNKILLTLEGDAKYAEEIEKSVYNAMLAAAYPNGEDWCYFILPNGRRHKAIWRDCCKSSGAIGLEEIPPAIYGITAEGVAINVYTPSKTILTMSSGKQIGISQLTNYPFEDKIKVVVNLKKAAEFTLNLRIPAWVTEPRVTINKTALDTKITPGSFLQLNRKWNPNDEVELHFPMEINIHTRTQKYDHRNKELYRIDYMGITRGPLTYATGLFDGYKKEDTFQIPKQEVASLFKDTKTPEGFSGPAVQLDLPDREPMIFLPYYESGGRVEGAWRLTWLQVQWQ